MEGAPQIDDADWGRELRAEQVCVSLAGQVVSCSLSLSRICRAREYDRRCCDDDVTCETLRPGVSRVVCGDTLTHDGAGRMPD